MPESKQPVETVFAEDRKSWRDWLAANHATSPGVWLVVFKKESGKQKLTYPEIVEDALSFGWIDNKANKVDSVSYKLKLSPRKPGSIWARSNKERVKKLIEGGLMTPAGLEKIEAAKADGSWNLMDNVEDLKLPDDLIQALAANKRAQTNFKAFGDSYKKVLLYWLESAKMPQTRANRITKIIESAALNENIRQFTIRRRA
jgi:uncharacterized protein YdeI (YjbR/CyaY-like superfamily)